MRGVVVAIDDERNVLSSLELVLRGDGWDVRCFNRLDGEAMAALASGASVLLLDMYLGRQRGLDLLPGLLEAHPFAPVVLLSGQAGPEEAVAGIRAGAYDFLEKPFSPERLVLSVGNAAAYGALRSRLAREALPVHESPAMAAVERLAARYARSGAPLLITGESGTGKDVVAGLVHALSPRAGAPFVKVNCGAIPGDLADSELFGHAKGAFTGADREYSGRIAPADGGTLFLDEVGELPPGVQVRLLRFLESGELQRVGDSGVRRADVRVIAATNRDLGRAAASGEFRSDLLYRLNVLAIDIPPLRERREDVIPLAERFLFLAAARDGSRPRALSDGARALLSCLPYPGNARELRNIAERLACVSDSELVTERDVLGIVGEPASAPGDGGNRQGSPPAGAGALSGYLGGIEALFSRAMPLASAKEALEKEYLRAQFALHGSSVRATAEALGILPNNLSRMMKRLGLP